METRELEEYQKLNKFQKDIVDALIDLGFTHNNYTNTYSLERWGAINVARFQSLSHLLQVMYMNGKDEKMREFREVLGL